ncbi:hypothetical protein AURDEDRAFT_148040 [Auricularia subglabra TFB-10046 SS5]|nr:hypothetical protein AURDEDRAFT_148040 [Auricularia subglabra TFB-10046 SS5]
MPSTSAQPIAIARPASDAHQPEQSPASPMLAASLEQRFSLGLSPRSFGFDAASALNDATMTDAMLLQEDMCRNYSCCGLALLDLHQLVEHFEEKHVVVVDDEDAADLLAGGGFDLAVAGDMELDEGHQPASAYSAGPAAFDNTSVLVARRARPSRRPTFAPYPPHRLRISELPCASPAVLFSPSNTPSPAVSRAPSPDPTQLARRPSKLSIAASEDTADSDAAPPRSKAYKCPKEGCNKSYKQANGLKYHLTHGQCNFAPVDPNSDEVKPYLCQAGCGKRFKNMSGLRYHYQHAGEHGKVGLALLQAGQMPTAS